MFEVIKILDSWHFHCTCNCNRHTITIWYFYFDIMSINSSSVQMYWDVKISTIIYFALFTIRQVRSVPGLQICSVLQQLWRLNYQYRSPICTIITKTLRTITKVHLLQSFFTKLDAFRTAFKCRYWPLFVKCMNQSFIGNFPV